MIRKPASLLFLMLAVTLLAAAREHPAQPAAPAATDTEAGIPVADPLVISKCGACHARDQAGNMERISWERATPEGWGTVLKRMVRVNAVALSPTEARSIIKYLSAEHGLTPEEAKPVMYDAERRIHDETKDIPNDILRGVCAKCHTFGRSLLWRRSPDDWKQFATAHAARYKVLPDEKALSFLDKNAPLHTPEWAAWSSRAHAPKLSGRWLVKAHAQGHGDYYGEMEISPGGAADEFSTRVTLRSSKDGSTITRSGRGLVYAGYAWRGRSQGVEAPDPAPDDLSNEAREALWFDPDKPKAVGRWFWGQYQEFGFDVTMQRASSGSTLIGVEDGSLKTGSRGTRIRLIGDHLPARVSPADLDFGPGVTVRRILSNNPGEVTAEVDVASDAAPGRRTVAVGRAPLENAVAIYDRVDYVKVMPESAMAAFGSQEHPRGYQQFEAIGYQRGADGKPHTADDVEVGPVDATWSMEVFYAVDSSGNDLVGRVSSTGFFTPAAVNPKSNYDVWVVATAKNEKDKDGKPLVGKSYMVVTVPSYTFNGRQYVRDLDRWVEDGSGGR